MILLFLWAAQSMYSHTVCICTVHNLIKYHEATILWLFSSSPCLPSFSPYQRNYCLSWSTHLIVLSTLSTVPYPLEGCRLDTEQRVKSVPPGRRWYPRGLILPSLGLQRYQGCRWFLRIKEGWKQTSTNFYNVHRGLMLPYEWYPKPLISLIIGNLICCMGSVNIWMP